MSYCALTGLQGQDVEGFFSGISIRLKSKEYLKVTGRVGIGSGLNGFRSDDGADRRQAPFTWQGNAGINFDVLGIQAPFSAAVSSKNTAYNLPSYSFVGISPSYKWITLHGGDRSMTFSPYSLSGVNFRGGGIELTPGRFYVGAMRGKLRRASILDAGSIQNLETAFRRVGSGLKVGYKSDKGAEISTSVFVSTDRPLQVSEGDSSITARPESNAILTLSGSQAIGKFLKFSFEYGRSALTRDQLGAPLPTSNEGPGLLGLIDPNVTTTAANAYKFQIGLQPSFGQLTIGYERIDPFYRSHGSLFFRNDFENFTAGTSLPLFDNKLTLSTNVGVQRNDLANQKASKLSRFIGSVNTSWQASKRVALNLAFSNFSSTTRYKAISRQLVLTDSIVLAQTQLSVNGGVTFLLNDEASQVLSVTSSWQRANLVKDEVVDTSAQSQFGLLLVNYSFQPSEGNGSFGASFMANRNVTPAAAITTLGPSVNYSRKLFDDAGSLSTGASYSIVLTDRAGATSGGVLQFQLGGGYQLGKKQSISLSSSVLRVTSSAAAAGYTDLRLSVNYGYTFN